MTSEVTELIKALREGTLSLDEVAQRFRERQWPRPQAPATRQLPGDGRQQPRKIPSPYVPGSFDDVAAAYDRGELTREQYRTLAEAVAESLRAEDRRLEEGQGGA